MCAALVSLPAVSLAQLRVEITGVGCKQFPIAVAPFQREGQVPVEIESDRARGSQRARTVPQHRCRLDAGGRDRAVESARLERPRRRCLTIGGSMPVWPTAATTCASGCSTRSRAGPDRRPVVRESERRRPAPDRASHRRSHLREAHRRARRVRHPHRVRRADLPQCVGTADRRLPTARIRSRHCARASRSSRRPGRPTGRGSPTCRSKLGKAVVYVHTVTTGERKAVANFRGSNSAPAWAPDGTDARGGAGARRQSRRSS